MPATVPRLLPPNIAQELKCALKNAASEAIRASQPSTNAPDVRVRKRLTAELRSCFEEALSELSSEFNIETTLLGRLSNELWCIVFSFLPIADLVRATHVCHKWRSVALAHPALWSTVTYISELHHDDCTCHLIKEGLLDEDEGCKHGPGSSNLRIVQAALARSGSMLPISLYVLIPRRDSSLDELGRLAAIVTPYLHRLAALHIRTDDEEAYGELFDQFSCMPALRTLSVRCPADSSGSASERAGGSSFLGNPLDLPVLETIELDIPENHDLHAPAALPALATLRLRYDHSRRILMFLNISPRLRRLCLTSAGLPPDVHPTVCESLRQKMRGVDDVQFMQISPAAEPGILDMFDSDAFNNILLKYQPFDSANPSVDGVRILRHLEAVDELSISRRCDSDCENLIVSARSPTGKTRALAFIWRQDAIDFNPSDLWRHLAAPPRSLVLDLLLWSVLEKIPLQAAAGVKNLTVFVSPSLELSSLAQRGPHLSGAFAGLDELEIAGYAWADALPLSSASLLSFVQWLCAAEGVQRLVIRHIRVDEHTAQLLCIARTVIVR